MISKKILVVLILIFGTYLLFSNNDRFRKNQTKTSPAKETQNQKSQSSQGFSILLGQQNSSNETGIATVEGIGGKTKITIVVTEFPRDVEQPIHIHLGDCSALKEIKYSLNNIVQGKSETVIDIDINDFIAEFPLIINIHKSSEEENLNVSCGDLLLE